MNHRHDARFARGIGALAATLALIVGVPILLATQVGWPLPTSIPTLDALHQAARSGVSDQVVVKILAIIAWIAWSQLTVALVVESFAVTRRRQARHLPVVPGAQTLAAHLVAGILMLAASIQPAHAGAAPPPTPLMVEATAATSTLPVDVVLPNLNSSARPLIAPTAPPATPAATGNHPTVTVQRHDSYWAIAERSLGDGLRWREVLDLNHGRALADGSTIPAGDHTPHTGWVLLLPADATSHPTTGPLAADTPSPVGVDQNPSTVVVARGDNVWSISEHRLETDLGREPADLEIVPYWRQVIDANRDRYVQPGNPNLILPGQVLVLPPTHLQPPAPTPADHATSPAPAPVPHRAPAAQPIQPAAGSTTIPDATRSTTPPTSAATPKTTPAHADQGKRDGSDHATGLVGIAVGGLSSIALAGGIKRLLDRRRRRFANGHPGHLPGRTPPDLHRLHHTVVAQADDTRIGDLQYALSSLAAALAETRSSRRPRIVRHSSDSLEVLLDQADPDAPAGWTSTDDGTVWTLTGPPLLDDLHDGPSPVAPLIVTVGQPEADAHLYLDLEAACLLALTGDRSVATNLACSIVTELALTPLADTLRVITVGDIVELEATILDHVTIVDSWDDIVDDVRAWTHQSHEALVENDWPNTFVARSDEPDHDALLPVAVIADRPPPTELSDFIRASQPTAVAVVVVGAFDGCASVIRCETDALTFDDIGLACTPQEIEPSQLAGMCRLLAATDHPDDEQLAHEPSVAPEQPVSSNSSTQTPICEDVEHDQNPSPDHSQPPVYDVLVRLLGDITVEGGRPLKAKATAVVAYLALHHSVTTERLEEACWFGADGTSHRKRLRDVMTEIRDVLGAQHFPANRNGSYVAGPRVGTDLDLFDWHAQRAAQLEPPAAVEHYRAALDLVSGKPFSYPNTARASYGWVDFEHHATEWEYRIANITQACAEMQLEGNEPGEAIAMLRRIVRAIPLNSVVVALLMRAHIVNDERAGAERVYQEHAAALEQAKLGDPDDAIELLRLEMDSA